MKERVRKCVRVTGLLILVGLMFACSTCSLAQPQGTRPRIVAPSGPKTTINVKSGGDLQAALKRAMPGDEVVLEAGATYVGNFVLPVRSDATTFITVRSSRSAELAEGRRVGPADAPRMARLATPNVGAALSAPPGSSYFRFVGLEFTQGEGTFEYGYNIIELGEGSPGGRQNTVESAPHHLEFDRCIVRARDSRTAVQRGITLNSAHTTIRNSHVSGIKWEGVETQALAGWNGPGPFLIENNYLEAAGVNVMFGGARATIPNLVPSDIQIRNNHLFKPLSWRLGDPAYQGIPWTVKNLLEFKTGRRVLVEGNLLENSWPQAQTGWAMVANIGSDTGPGNSFEDVIVRRNIFRNVSNGVNLRGMEPSDSATKLHRFTFANNLIENIGVYGGEGKVFQLLQGTEDVSIDHNTVTGMIRAALLLNALPNFYHSRLVFTNNIVPHGDYGVFGDGVGIGTAALKFYCRRWVFSGNVFSGADPARYPSGNYYPTIPDLKLYADAPGQNYRIANPKFKGRATDGKDPGCDFTELEAALSWYLRPAA